MELAKKLSVITPVSRPELLPLVASSVPGEAEWVLVTDGPLEIPSGLRPHVLIEGPKTGQWGDLQRQIGLEAATGSYIYFLDDDNLMLPVLADLLVPYLEAGNRAGVVFGLLIHFAGETHLWPPPLRFKLGRVDTAMFFGRREAILELRYRGFHGCGWPNLQGGRGADFMFLEAFENKHTLPRLPAIYGFHNAIDLVAELEPDLYSDLEAGKLVPQALPTLLNRYMIRADVPSFW